jgi:alkylhydroperoxidase family enzyme
MPPRIPMLAPEQVAPEVREIFERFMRVRGNIPNMFRTLAYRPDIALTADAHMNAILEKGTVDRALKEMVVVRTSAANRCSY